MKNWSRYDSISTLNSIMEIDRDKYQYNLARYLNRPTIDIDNNNEWNADYTESFVSLFDPDLTNGPNMNVIKSVIDSLVSKLSNNKVRPFFNSIDGTYHTKKIVKQVQIYFDHLYEKINADAIISMAFRNACIFGIGYIFLDPFTYEISCAPSYNIAMLNSEQKRTKLLYKIKNAPAPFFTKYGLQIDTLYADFAMFIDVIDHKATIFINGAERKSIKYNFDELPIVLVYFNEPVIGLKTVSVADELEGIQTHIDLLNAKISACAQLSPAMTIYVHENSNVKAADINNKVGNVFELRMPVGSSNLPVQYVNPSLHDPQWTNELDFYVQKAYDMIGISQLSAQSRKPSGLNSGAALQTMEDIESDRFETQVSHFVRAYTDLAKMIIRVMPDDKDILEGDAYRSSMKWADIKKESNNLRIQYSGMSVLSKDPAEKLKQLLEMSQAGVIGADKVAEYMEIPDLEDAYSDAQAVKNAISQVIERAIEKGDYNIPEFVNYAELSKEIAIQENQLYAAISDDNDNKEVLMALLRLEKLDETLINIMETQGFIDPTSEIEDKTSESGIGAGAQTTTQAISSADAMAQNGGM